MSALAFTYSVTNSGHVIKWYNDNPTFELQLDADGPSRKRAGTTLADVDAAFNRAMSSWNSVSCSEARLTLDDVRTTSTVNLVSKTESTDNLDYINRVVWIENRPDYQFSSSVLGVTSAIYYQDGTIIEADIALNDVDVTWAVFTSEADAQGGGATDVESVLVHEMGHLLGLAHVLDGQDLADPPTMSPVVDTRLRTRTLSADDRDAICLLYPASTYRCDDDGDCPRFITSEGASDGGAEKYNSTVSQCASGACNNVKTVPCGDGSLGERCCTDNCTGSLFCLSLGSSTDMRYCASSCSTSSRNCPDGFTCVGTSAGGTNGACITSSVTGCGCDTDNVCTNSCACDTDCGASGNTGNDDGGCNAVGGAWAALVGAVFLMRRARLL